MSLVSIIMPYFKKKNYIEKSINSVLNQSYNNYEIIIIYDDIDKNDISFIKKIQNLDNRIHVIYNSSNLGAGFSRNIGISQAKGDLIAFLDCDDFWHESKLELQIKFMKENKSDFSFTAYDLINSAGQKIGHRVASRFLNYDNLIKSCDIGLSTVMMKKFLFSDFFMFSNLKTKEDYALWLQLAKKK